MYSKLFILASRDKLWMALCHDHLSSITWEGVLLPSISSQVLWQKCSISHSFLMTSAVVLLWQLSLQLVLKIAEDFFFNLFIFGLHIRGFSLKMRLVQSWWLSQSMSPGIQIPVWTQQTVCAITLHSISAFMECLLSSQNAWSDCCIIVYITTVYICIKNSKWHESTESFLEVAICYKKIPVTIILF